MSTRFKIHTTHPNLLAIHQDSPLSQPPPSPPFVLCERSNMQDDVGDGCVRVHASKFTLSLWSCCRGPQGARKEIFLKATDEVLAQVEKDVLGFRDTEPFKARARTDTFLMTENDQKKRTIKEFEDSVLNEFKTQISKWEGKAPREFNDAATFTGVYSRLLQMLHLTELKKRYWLQSPEDNLNTIGGLSLKVIDTMLSLALFARFHHSLSLIAPFLSLLTPRPLAASASTNFSNGHTSP
eukprot:3716384-Rhodomonas_salina.1